MVTFTGKILIENFIFCAVNLHILATDIYKSKNGMSTEIINDIFNSIEKWYNFWNGSILQKTSIKGDLDDIMYLRVSAC